MKKLDNVLKDYVSHLSIDSLKYLASRLEERLGPDLGEAVNAMATNQEVDRWLQSARNHEEFYDCVDTVQEYVVRELNKRVPDLLQA